jgi:hypothetical protein
VQATPQHEATIEVQELPAQCHDGVSERWLLCRSAGCRLKEQQICDARLLKARQRLAKLQQQVVDRGLKGDHFRGVGGGRWQLPGEADGTS